jgi:ABC-type bacteriocin/lantibiotic exporter with double-glycine peptidase domain
MNKKLAHQFLNIIGKKKIIHFTFFSSINLFLELLSFSLFIPVILALSGSDKKDFISEFIYKQFKIESSLELLMILLIVLIVVFFIKNLIISFCYYKQSKISASIEQELSLKIFSSYLYADYIFHTKENSSKIIRDIMSEIGMFCRGLLNSVLIIFLEFFVFLGIFSLLFFYAPKVSLYLSFYFLIISIVFFLIFKKRIEKMGVNRNINEKLRIKYIQQGIQGIKEVLIFNLQEIMLKFFKGYNNIVINNLFMVGFINKLPKLIFEFLSITILFVVFFINFRDGNDISEITYSLGIIIAGSYKLFPSMNKILQAVNTINYSKPAIKSLANILFENKLNEKNKSLDNDKIFKIENEIIIKDLNFKYETKNPNIFENLNLKIKSGSRVGIMGATGSGKTTLVDLLLGLLKPLKGDILSDEKSIYKDVISWRSIIGYVTQAPYLMDDTVLNNIVFGDIHNEIDHEKVNKIIKITQLSKYIESSQNGLQTIIGERGVQLSGGQIQRIAIARALYRDLKILILDEATSSLDSTTRDKIIKEISDLNSNITIISISHDKKALSYCDDIYHLNEGSLIKI